MAIGEAITRQFAGHDESGQPTFSTIRHGYPARPESIAEWVHLAVATLGSMAPTYAQGRAVIALLEAGERADVKAAGRDLTEMQRWAVLKTLETMEGHAGAQYAPAVTLARGLRLAWVKQWGEKEPKPPRQRVRVA